MTTGKELRQKAIDMLARAFDAKPADQQPLPHVVAAAVTILTHVTVNDADEMAGRGK
jgi:hypothetical protein